MLYLELIRNIFGFKIEIGGLAMYD
jgi:hypothetical protein